MPSYLLSVKDELEGEFVACFERVWRLLEQRLKESYANGVEAGKRGEAPASREPPRNERRRFRRGPREAGEADE